MWKSPFFLVRASTAASRVDHFFLFLWSVLVIAGVIVFGLILSLGLKYCARSKIDHTKPSSMNCRWEMVWIGVALALVLITMVWGHHVITLLRRVPADAETIDVVGQQWLWKIQHQQGVRELNQLHVPLGRPIRLLMISQDVVHGLSIPAFRVQQDVLPGRYTSLWFQATRAGRYPFVCSRYCGAAHASMAGEVIVMNPLDYDSWLGQPSVPVPSTPAAAGDQIFHRYGCISCHRSDRLGDGPLLRRLYGSTVHLTGGKTIVADDRYIRESILEPRAALVEGYQPSMPTFKGQLNEKQIQQLIAYIKSLK